MTARLEGTLMERSTEYQPLADIEIDEVRPEPRGFTLAGQGADHAEYRVGIRFDMPLDARTRADLSLHLAGCARCQALAADLDDHPRMAAGELVQMLGVERPELLLHRAAHLAVLVVGALAREHREVRARADDLLLPHRGEAVHHRDRLRREPTADGRDAEGENDHQEPDVSRSATGQG